MGPGKKVKVQFLECALPPRFLVKTGLNPPVYAVEIYEQRRGQEQQTQQEKNATRNAPDPIKNISATHHEIETFPTWIAF